MSFFLSKTTSLGYVDLRRVVSFLQDITSLLGYVRFKSCGVVFLKGTISLGFGGLRFVMSFFLSKPTSLGDLDMKRVFSFLQEITFLLDYVRVKFCGVVFL